MFMPPYMRFKEDLKIIKMLDIGTYKDWSKYLGSSYILHAAHFNTLSPSSKVQNMFLVGQTISRIC